MPWPLGWLLPWVPRQTRKRLITFGLSLAILDSPFLFDTSTSFAIGHVLSFILYRYAYLYNIFGSIYWLQEFN